LPNLEEAEAITGHSDPKAAIRALSDAFPVVALKGGAQGAWVSAQAGLHHAAAKSVPVIDTTGAGDAFNAGFIDAWLRREGEKQCLEAGVAAGSLAVQATGGAPRANAAA
ncbi:MAG TPA: ribokinase, partial [Agrobacterium sp.]|nr:ribokinase [Agrobacterium sp.]